MDYSKLAARLTAKLMRAIAIINNPEIAPDIRQRNQEILLREVGTAVYEKVYDMNAFDYDLAGTRGPGLDDRYYGLAKVASASVATGSLGLDEYVRNYLNTAAALAQDHATKNARQSGKRTKVIRKMNGETCKWCESLAGSYENPDSEVFRRHGGCDCIIITEGFKSRNGQLNNYVKPQDR